jgi:hypothetical protein
MGYHVCMKLLSSMNLTTALSNGFMGMFNSGQRHYEASQEVLQSSATAININYSTGGVEDRVTISSLNENMTDPPSLEQGFMELSKAGTTYNASAKIVSSANALFDALFRAIA